MRDYAQEQQLAACLVEQAERSFLQALAACNETLRQKADWVHECRRRLRIATQRPAGSDESQQKSETA